jgi:hypothetical protein
MTYRHQPAVGNDTPAPIRPAGLRPSPPRPARESWAWPVALFVAAAVTAVAARVVGR